MKQDQNGGPDHPEGGRSFRRCRVRQQQADANARVRGCRDVRCAALGDRRRRRNGDGHPHYDGDAACRLPSVRNLLAIRGHQMCQMASDEPKRESWVSSFRGGTWHGRRQRSDPSAWRRRVPTRQSPVRGALPSSLGEPLSLGGPRIRCVSRVRFEGVGIILVGV